MTRSDGIRIAVESLIENPLRTLLTLLGVAIGVAAVIFVISVIEGLDGYVANAMSDLKPDVFVLDKFGIIKGHDEWVRAQRRNKDLKKEDAEAVRSLAHLAGKVGVSQFYTSSARYGNQTATDVTVRGASAEVMEIEPFDVDKGRGLTPGDVEHSARAAFLGYEVAENLFGHLDPIGREIRVLGRQFEVVGVAAKKGSVFGQSRDNFVLIPITVFHRILGTQGWVMISVQSRDPQRMDAALDEARSILRARHHLRYNDDDDFGVVTSEGIMGFWRDLTGTLFRVAIFVVSISLVVGGIVIMNVMLLSVVERTREIGVRKAVGARQSDIKFQFLVESLILCSAGGLTGALIGWLGTWAVRTQTVLPASFPWWAPLLAAAVTSAVGVFFGIYPAKTAGKLDPIEALRSEET
ncbi:MAG: ABC transporter permease [Candidatus Sumerlaeota bacterium]|nr:ABC transporter permease [Candidatus Sumerlaeota bacterium]